VIAPLSRRSSRCRRDRPWSARRVLTVPWSRHPPQSMTPCFDGHSTNAPCRHFPRIPRARTTESLDHVHRPRALKLSLCRFTPIHQSPTLRVGHQRNVSTVTPPLDRFVRRAGGAVGGHARAPIRVAPAPCRRGSESCPRHRSSMVTTDPCAASGASSAQFLFPGARYDGRSGRPPGRRRLQRACAHRPPAPRTSSSRPADGLIPERQRGRDVIRHRSRRLAPGSSPACSLRHAGSGLSFGLSALRCLLPSHSHARFHYPRLERRTASCCVQPPCVPRAARESC